MNWLKSLDRMVILENNLVLLALTLVTFFFARKIQRRTGLLVLNPILVSVVAVISFLRLTGVDYEAYERCGSLLVFWLKPAIVALGVPLYLLLRSIRRAVWCILLSQLAGCVVGVVSVVVIADVLGATREVVLSLAAKSVTTPIAMEITEVVGGVSSLTASVVVCVGLFGAMAGFWILRLCRVTSVQAQGLAMGTAAHVVGTAAAMERSTEHGAYASLGIVVNGLFTSIFTPVLLGI